MYVNHAMAKDRSMHLHYALYQGGHHFSVHPLTFTTQCLLLTTLRKKPYENIVGKGENAGNQHFLLFPQCFLAHQSPKSSVWLNSYCRLQLHPILISLKC